ncbi:hypothetical protein GCM10022297_05030 [Lactobacillus hamsteri]|uniref:LITAF domain-containing protein n=1 Tax=Lactobacillus hamsteri DSM 5661 = JCM 6256 TaxID=1423754 RepID=A0A0R1YMP1_9LACO|nr:hypothetical protein [Lactobacillus hamsteri]KRM41227.1 hypothetical protein FC39_GL001238 [Lactobacillus hamsteri DSM 5661 = JCM 6256]
MFNKEARKAKKQAKLEKKQAKLEKLNLYRMSCPRCKSEDFTILGQHKKGFSVGKAVVGTALTGGVGSLAGFAGKKSKKLDIICNKCGRQYKAKPIS